MADTSTQQPTVFDYATSTQWRLVFNRLPKTTWFCTAANIPGITLGEAMYPTPFGTTSITGDQLTFETLNFTFIVDEELQNYRELWNWLIGLGAPVKYSQWADVLSKGDSGSIQQSSAPDSGLRDQATSSEANLYSDGTLIVYNSKNIPKVEVKFKDMFPISLSSLDYTQEATDVEYFKATASFRYLYYEFETSK